MGSAEKRPPYDWIPLSGEQRRVMLSPKLWRRVRDTRTEAEVARAGESPPILAESVSSFAL